MSGNTPAEIAQNKRKRKREKEKTNKRTAENPKVPKLETDHGRISNSSSKPWEPKKPAKPETINESIANMDPNLIADYISRQLRRFEKEISAVELEDRSVSTGSFLDTTSYGKERTLENLPEFLETFSNGKQLNTTSQTPGAPHTIIVTAAALRATDLARSVKKFQTKDSMVAKLFAKHIKLSESIDLCRSTRIGLGVGTPARLLALILEGSLKLDYVDTVVLDMSGVNEKQQGIFDIRETHKDVLDLLNTPLVKSRLDGKMKLLAY
ncbi:U3-containing 90S pre-ribosomal complex subunit-domain containing protein [Pyronema domesticum]|nr:U3-containing 90S pre-ribosomal complex subunit-domain containing protein [Pyronema domesticum]